MPTQKIQESQKVLSDSPCIRKVLSFDVGIINLAYCILEINDTEKTFKINKWDIINMADDRVKCSYVKATNTKTTKKTIKNGSIKADKPCGKIANRVVKIDEHNCQHYCTAHVGKAKLDVRDMYIKLHKLKTSDEKCCTLCKKSAEYCSKQVNDQIVHGDYCTRHQQSVNKGHNHICSVKKCNSIITKGLYLKCDQAYDQASETSLKLGWCDEHYEAEYTNLLKKKTKKALQNSNKIPLPVLATSMYAKLDQIPELMTVDEVLVENQPTFINPTMKSISAILFSYFVMRGLHERDKTKSTISKLAFCSPSNKIKVGGTKTADKIENTKVDKKYKITKKLGVKFCKALVNDCPEYIKMIDAHKKQDDLADAFLQGFIMNFGQPLPEHYAVKVKEIIDSIVDDEDGDDEDDEDDKDDGENGANEDTADCKDSSSKKALKKTRKKTVKKSNKDAVKKTVKKTSKDAVKKINKKTSKDTVKKIIENEDDSRGSDVPLKIGKIKSKPPKNPKR